MDPEAPQGIAQEHLLLYSLGPVQDFIAAARRCQDLWFGSWLLSDLARAAATAIEAADGSTLVFPAALGNEKPAVSNKILACLPAEVRPDDVSRAATDAVTTRLRQLGELAFGRLPEPSNGWFHDDVALSQLGDLMEFQWVSVPLAAGNYPTARRLAESLLASRKATRTWAPVPWHHLDGGGDGVPKSSLDGSRESVLDKALFHLVRDRKRTPEWLRANWFVTPAERLCGVGLLKRLGTEPGEDEDGFWFPNVGERPAFHSTSHVAAAPLLVRVTRQPGAREALDRYLGALRDEGIHLRRFRIRSGQARTALLANPLAPPDDSAEATQVDRTFAARAGWGLDGVLLFEGRLADVLDEGSGEEATADEPARRAALTRLRQALAACLAELGLSTPTPYYALLLADGDKMGRAIDALGDLDRHRQLAGALVRFADGCRDLVEQHAGSLVYAGGDDVLALLPLHTALDCARALRRQFHEALRPVFPPSADVPTLSVGLGIGHHLEPLRTVRELASQAERLAKDGGRDSLAIVASKRSGATLSVAARWADDLPGRLYAWCRRYDEQSLPHGAAFALEEAVRPLTIAGSEAAADLGAAAEALTRRVVGRRRPTTPDGGALAADVADALTTHVCTAADPVAAVMDLSAELQIARLFLSALRDAWGSRAEEETS